MPTVVDLFCGVGGLTHGFVRHGGFDVVAGVDVDTTCRYAYEANNPGAVFLERDVDVLTGAELAALFPEGDVKVLVGCAPCQPFSTYSHPHRRTGGTEETTGKWRLVPRFAELIEECAPDVVSMENVPALAKHPAFAEFRTSLENAGYRVWFGIVDCVDYGIPQTRRRLVLLASQAGAIELVPPTHARNRHVTVRQTIGHLPAIVAGGTDPNDSLHSASALNETNLRRMEASRPGGSWRDWPEELQLDCHRRETGRSFGSVYGRMSWDTPSPTMTTQCNGIGNGRFGHPEQDRAISLREAALFQTFPREYQFAEHGTRPNMSNLARHIGNAVPVRLGEVIAESIALHLEAAH